MPGPPPPTGNDFPCSILDIANALRDHVTSWGICTPDQFIVTALDPGAVPHLLGDFDFVFSIIALQHMVPPLMLAYIEQLCDSLHSGGHGFFQIPTKLLADYSQFRCDFSWSMHEGGMQVWYLERDQVVAALARRSCKVLEDFNFDMIGIPQSESRAFFFEKA